MRSSASSPACPCGSRRRPATCASGELSWSTAPSAELVTRAAYDQHPPQDAPGGEPVIARASDAERFERENRFVTIRFELPQLSLVEIEFDSSFEVPPHEHDDQVDSFLVVDGSVEFVRGDETVVLEPGDFVAAPQGLRHGFRSADERPA